MKINYIEPIKFKLNIYLNKENNQNHILPNNILTNKILITWDISFSKTLAPSKEFKTHFYQTRADPRAALQTPL